MKDEFTKKWIIENSIEICREYDPGILTLRALHYQLVGLGMTNDIQHYKRVVDAMTDARWDGIIPFEQFSDRERDVLGHTAYEEVIFEESVQIAKEQIEAWMTNYQRNKWERQRYYVEVVIEKKALIGVFEPVCKANKVALSACKGYPSLTFVNEMASRMRYVGREIVILYFGDHDPSGDDIPRSLIENLERLGVTATLERVALTIDQVKEWHLPPAPVKHTDTRSKNWEGVGQVELDAVKPEKLQALCSSAIGEFFDETVFSILKEEEEEETEKFIWTLKEFVRSL